MVDRLVYRFHLGKHCVWCAWEHLYYPDLCGDSCYVLNPPWWPIEEPSGSLSEPTLCRYLNGDIASVVEVNFDNKSLILCAYCVHLYFLT
jgi:hypothetical protein